MAIVGHLIGGVVHHLNNLTSGYSENATIHDGDRGAGELLLAKPYRKVDLARMIRTVIAGRNKADSDTHNVVARC
jgi:hypothetical protein